MDTDEENPATPGFDGIPVIGEDIAITELDHSDLKNYVSRAADLYVNRFSLETAGRLPVEDDVATTENDGSLKDSMVLLAKKVSPDDFDNCFLPIKARYFLDDNGDLYVRKVPGSWHAGVHSEVIGNCIAFRDNNGARGVIKIKDAFNQGFGGEKLEPDVSIQMKTEDGSYVSTCVIEVEVYHRTPRQARELAKIFMQDPNVNLIILIKVFGRHRNNTFAAACVVWARGENGSFECTDAYDFGTALIDQVARDNLSGLQDGEQNIGPIVPQDKNYTAPLPEGHRQIQGREPQVVVVPAEPIVVNVPHPYPGRASLVNLTPPLAALRLDLTIYAAEIGDEILPDE